jgi:hypothetical protein
MVSSERSGIKYIWMLPPNDDVDDVDNNANNNNNNNNNYFVALVR